MLRVNLHIHSTCSDGVYTPTELVHLLYRNGVSVAALTDHDTALGVRAFLAGCHRHGVRAVSGVEFSSEFEDTGIELHILGYRFDLENSAINAVFEKYRTERERRNEIVCEKLSALGCKITMDEVIAKAKSEAGASSGAGTRVNVANMNVNKSIGRPHIAQVLKDKGYVETIRQAFTRYLGEGAPAFVPRRLMPAKEIIHVILEAGGFPVWAHPMASLASAAAASDPCDLAKLGESAFPEILDELKDAGLRGVECWAHGATSGQIFTCLNAAGARGLLMTAGTDFHGRAGHNAKISGCVVPDDLLPWARFCGGR